MAVSQQWFIQWSPPSTVFNDISSQYKSINENFNNFNPVWNNKLPLEEQYKSDYNNRFSKPNTEQKLQNGYDMPKRSQPNCKYCLLLLFKFLE